MTIEQFIQGVPDDLRVWLSERKPETLRQAAVLADHYVLARKDKGRTPPCKVPVPTQIGGGDRPTDDRNSGPLKRYERPGQNTYGGCIQTNARGERKCFQYNRYSHLMYDCPLKPSPTTSATSKALFGSICHTWPGTRVARSTSAGGA